MKDTSYGRGYGHRGGGFGGYRPMRPKPVEVGKEYEVDITEISRRGDGIAKIEGFIIFVARAKAGQHVRIRITNVSNRYAKGEIVEAASEEKQE